MTFIVGLIRAVGSLEGFTHFPVSSFTDLEVNMFRQSRGSKLFSGAIAAAATFAVGGSGAYAQIDILVPAYFYPGVDGNGNSQDDWQDMVDAVDAVGVTAIMNPASGSGTSANTDYQSAVSDLQNAGGLVIGYIHSSWGARSFSQLQTEIQNYINWYDVDGFFVDEMPTTYFMGQLTQTEQDDIYDYYADLYDYIDQYNGHDYVIGNAGNLTEEDFFDNPTADVLVTFENDYSVQAMTNPPPSGSSTYTPAGWTSGYDATEFAMIQHNVPNASAMEDVVDAALGKNFGLLYITDDSGANPFDRLPTYWDDFVDKIEAESGGGGGGGVPEPASAALFTLAGLTLLRRK